MSTVTLDDRSPQLMYSGNGNWMQESNPPDFDGTSTLTSTAGATVSLVFNVFVTVHINGLFVKGTSISVYGGINAQHQFNSTITPQSSYVIDNQNPVIFSPVLTSAEQRQVLFFQANNLTSTSHTLVITSLKPNGIFILDYLSYSSIPVVQDDNTGGSDSGGSHNGNDPHSKGDHNNHSHNSSNTDAIVGAVIGTLALLLLAVSAFIGLKYYKKKALNISPKTPNMNQYQPELGVGLNPPQYERY